jgi:hypothetical protein
VIVSAMANPDGGSSGVGSVVCPGMPIGGCPGGSGGLGTSTPAAFGGPGGGALYMTSQMGVSIAASGALTAGGAGGAGGLLGTAGNQGGGGGGGGAGGMIMIETPALQVDGVIAANGGGGAEGGGSGTSGRSGEDGQPSGSFANGGGGLSNGGNGGNGGTGSSDNGDSADSLDTGASGGGGGGGVGFIRIPLDFTGSGYTLSPDPCP